MSPAGLILLVLAWSGLVWAGARLVCRLKPSPRQAQLVWRLAAVALIAPFAASLFMPALPRTAVAPLPELPVMEPLFILPVAGEGLVADQPVRLPEIGTLLIGLVAAGWLVRLALWLASQARLQGLKRLARKTDRPIGHWAEAVGLASAPGIHVTPRGAPFLAGILKRSVYVPAALIRGEAAQQVIVHELVHLKRGDLVTRPLERLVADIFWFSPFAWAMRAQLDYWREAVVDETAAGLTGDRIAYARALTRAARLARPVTALPVAAFILKKEGTLKMRLNELLAEKARPRRLGLVMAVALACAAPLALAQGMLIKGAAALPGASVTYSHAVLDKARLTSAFGVRVHPIDKTAREHNGVDLALAEGEPVYAPADGIIAVAEFRKGYGNLVQLDVSDSVRLRFGQLSAMDVEAGQTVKAGDVIGLVGQSGVATGPHLHLEVWRGDAPVDPQAEDGLVLANDLKVLAGSGAKAPLSPVAPVAPESASPPVPAPAAPAGVQPLPTAAPAPSAPPDQPDACQQHSSWLAAPDTSPAWAERKAAAQAANAAAGLDLDAGWIPEMLAWPVPSYPAAAASSGSSGACVVMFDLGTDGLPKNMLAECSDPVFAESAAEMPRARFEPAKGADGRAVEVKGVIYPLTYCVQ